MNRNGKDFDFQKSNHDLKIKNYEFDLKLIYFRRICFSFQIKKCDDFERVPLLNNTL